MKSREVLGSRLGQVFFPDRAANGGDVSQELVNLARKRLGIAALVIGFVFGVVPIAFGGVFRFILGSDVTIRQVPLTFASFTLISILLYLATRTHRLSARQAVRLGVFYELFLALGLSLLEARLLHAFGARASDIIWGVSTVCILILVFPLLLPMSPRKTFAVAAVAWLLGPLCYFLVVYPQTRELDWLLLARVYIPTGVAADLAWIPALIVKHLSGQLSRARDLGSYRLVEKLGQGGMGEVWRAEHRLLARPAAVKLVRRPASGESEDSRRHLLQRFEREAQATAGLRSPHTVDLYDFGLTADGSFYYVMELLDGLDLESLVKRHGAQPAERVAAWLIQACHSLRNAHENGLIHRDIKPSNLFACRSGSDVDVLKVLDFGLVKSSRSPGDDQLTLTQHGAITGTPAYMAPEMIMEEGEVDGRADLYSLGCVAYLLLTGVPVFEGDSAMKVMVQHAKETPPPPSERSELPMHPGLEKIILACLEKEPGRRPGSARELSASLKTLGLAGAWTETRAREWWETHRPQVAASAGEAAETLHSPI